MTSDVTGSAPNIPLGMQWGHRKRLAEQQIGGTPLRIPVSKLKPVGIVAVTAAAYEVLDRKLIAAYDEQAKTSAPNAAVDKLKGILDLADLNRLRSDADKAADLDADDMTKIEQVVSKNMSQQNGAERSEFIHNVYRAYLAKHWDEVSNG